MITDSCLGLHPSHLSGDSLIEHTGEKGDKERAVRTIVGRDVDRETEGLGRKRQKRVSETNYYQNDILRTFDVLAKVIFSKQSMRHLNNITSH